MNNPESVYLFLGPENGQKNQEIQGLIESWKQNSGENPEVYKFYPFETSMGEVVSLLKNGSLFSSYKFVILMNIDDLKKEDVKELIQYIKSPGENCSLILVSDKTSADKKIASAVPRKNSRIFWELFENQKKTWIANYFRREKIEISPDAVDMILEMVDNNTSDLQAACGKLAIFFGAGTRIEESDIENFIYHSKEENVFTLFKKVAAGDFGMSLEILHKIILTGEGSPIQLLSGLLWQFRKLLALSLLIKEHYTPEEAFEKTRIKGKRNQQTYMAGLRTYSVEELQQIMVLVARYDISAREMNKEQHLILMELFLHYCINRKGKQPEKYR